MRVNAPLKLDAPLALGETAPLDTDVPRFNAIPLASNPLVVATPLVEPKRSIISKYIINRNKLPAASEEHNNYIS